jgi:hypothetical protein
MVEFKSSFPFYSKILHIHFKLKSENPKKTAPKKRFSSIWSPNIFTIKNPDIELMSSKVTISPFFVIGIAIHNSNENGKASKVLGDLWGKFQSKEIARQVSNPINPEIYSMYTE